MSQPLAARLLDRLANRLQMLGIDLSRGARAALGQLLLTTLLAQPTDLHRLRHWRQQLAPWYPHVNWQRPSPADFLRIVLQSLWLLLVRPPAPPAAARPTGHWHRYRRRLHLAFRRRRRAQPIAAPTTPPSRWQQWWQGLQLRSNWRRWVETSASLSLWDQPVLRYSAYLIAGALGLLCITTPFSTLAQALFVLLLWGIAMLIRNIPGPVATLLLVVLSVTTSTRYLWWRAANTLNTDDWFDLAWGSLLFAAEIYTWIILILGYIQTAWPLRRQPVPLPADTSLWPTVDVFIPSYNEPLKVVKPTVFAALGMDWPADKLNIYILDDGRRDEFRAFAEEIGVGYLIRPDNRHAKAGNINHALTQTDGQYVAIFDCDHIPTRSFLQVTMGGFLRDEKLALVQTPHHFFSPDPFERNLGLFRRVPNEGELFYGLIQDGNDLWNATFFCGSCAVIKRGPLEQVGGIAVETVTEDAHTALKLQRLGYNSAYLRIPQAAGLATESLSAHIGQRIRWARGMAQIFRLDNPFLGKGLTLAQRICYSNAMLHFLNGGPRLIFLTAPLAFLLFHAYVIYAPALSVALYVLPHMLHASLTNSRMQGEHRHSFWAEVYETVLAWYILRPTTVALLNPKHGKFNVTAKGGLVEKQYFDWTIAVPYLTLVLLNLLGFGIGIYRALYGPGDEIPTVLLNLFWTGYNILLLGGAIAVASEAKQVRLAHRVRLHLPAIVHLPGGQLLRASTEDFSEGGVALTPTQLPKLKRDDPVQVSLWRGSEEHIFPARVAALTDTQLRLRWELTTQAEEMALVQCTFARADAWVTWSEGRRRDRPLEGLREILGLGVRGYRRLLEHSAPYLEQPLSRLQHSHQWLRSLLPQRPAGWTAATP